MLLGNKIRAGRAAKGEKGWSQQELGDAINKSRSLIGQIEKNHTGNEETLRLIEKALGIHLLSDEPSAAEPQSEYLKKDARIKELEVENEGLKKELAAKDKIIKLQEQLLEPKKLKSAKPKGK